MGATKSKSQRKKYLAPLTLKLRTAYKQLNKLQKREALKAFATAFDLQPSTVRHKISGVNDTFDTEVFWMETHVENIKSGFLAQNQPVAA